MDISQFAELTQNLQGALVVSHGQVYFLRPSSKQRIRLLPSIFTSDLCAHAVMSNHYHLVVKLCPEQTEE